MITTSVLPSMPYVAISRILDCNIFFLVLFGRFYKFYFRPSLGKHCSVIKNGHARKPLFWHFLHKENFHVPHLCMKAQIPYVVDYSNCDFYKDDLILRHDYAVGEDILTTQKPTDVTFFLTHASKHGRSLAVKAQPTANMVYYST